MLALSFDCHVVIVIATVTTPADSAHSHLVTLV